MSKIGYPVRLLLLVAFFYLIDATESESKYFPLIPSNRVLEPIKFVPIERGQIQAKKVGIVQQVIAPPQAQAQPVPAPVPGIQQPVQGKVPQLAPLAGQPPIPIGPIGVFQKKGQWPGGGVLQNLPPGPGVPMQNPQGVLPNPSPHGFRLRESTTPRPIDPQTLPKGAIGGFSSNPGHTLLCGPDGKSVVDIDPKGNRYTYHFSKSTLELEKKQLLSDPRILARIPPELSEILSKGNMNTRVETASPDGRYLVIIETPEFRFPTDVLLPPQGGPPGGLPQAPPGAVKDATQPISFHQWIVDTKTGKTLSFRTGKPELVYFSGDSTKMYSLKYSKTGDSRLEIKDLPNGATSSVKLGKNILPDSISTTGRYITYLDPESTVAHVRDLQTGKDVIRYSSPQTDTNAPKSEPPNPIVRISEDEKLAIGFDGTHSHAKVQVYDLPSGRTKYEYTLSDVANNEPQHHPDGSVSSGNPINSGNILAFSPSGDFFVRNTPSGPTIHEAISGKQVELLEFKPLVQAQFCDSGKLLITRDGHGKTLIFDVARTLGSGETDVQKLWKDLASEDPAQAFKAAWSVLPEHKGFLEEQQKNEETAQKEQEAKWTPEEIQKTIKKLGDDNFRNRDISNNTLKKEIEAGVSYSFLKSSFLPQLRAAAAASPSLEIVRRLRSLIEFAEIRLVQPDSVELRRRRLETALQRIALNRPRS